MDTATALRTAAKRVVDSWESGDLASAVRALGAALGSPSGDGEKPLANSLTLPEAVTLAVANGNQITLADYTASLAIKRDAYDLAAVATAREYDREVEIDDTALTSRSDDPAGCFVQAWVWVDRADMDLPDGKASST